MNWFDMLVGLVILHATMATVAVAAGLLSCRERVKRMALGLLSAVLLMQSTLVIAELARYWGGPVPRAVYLEGLAWLLAVTCFVVWRRKRLQGVVILLAPFTLVTALAAMLVDGQAAPPQAVSKFFTIHIVCMFPALACMALACGAGILFMVQERGLKTKQPMTGFRRAMPALSSLDTVNAVTTMAGFPLYSLGILFGLVSARMTWGTLFSGDPKELVSLAVWGLYAFLFHQRLAKGWRGRKPAELSLAIFVVAVFSLFVVNTFMNTHHSFF